MSGYSTNLGQCICGDSLEELARVDDASINLVVTQSAFRTSKKKSIWQ